MCVVIAKVQWWVTSAFWTQKRLTVEAVMLRIARRRDGRTWMRVRRGVWGRTRRKRINC
jgi:hypothetical protein